MSLHTFPSPNIATIVHYLLTCMHDMCTLSNSRKVMLYVSPSDLYSWCGQSQTWWAVELLIAHRSQDYQYCQMSTYLCATMHLSKFVFSQYCIHIIVPQPIISVLWFQTFLYANWVWITMTCIQVCHWWYKKNTCANVANFFYTHNIIARMKSTFVLSLCCQSLSSFIIVYVPKYASMSANWQSEV